MLLGSKKGKIPAVWEEPRKATRIGILGGLRRKAKTHLPPGFCDSFDLVHTYTQPTLDCLKPFSASHPRTNIYESTDYIV